jgi:hypothetical protein
MMQGRRTMRRPQETVRNMSETVECGTLVRQAVASCHRPISETAMQTVDLKSRPDASLYQEDSVFINLSAHCLSESLQRCLPLWMQSEVVGREVKQDEGNAATTDLPRSRRCCFRRFRSEKLSQILVNLAHHARVMLYHML